MPITPLISILGYLFSLFYGTAAVYLVFETKNQCPFRWPFLFGSVGCLSHFAIRDVPDWWPPSITKDMILALLLLTVLFLGVELLRRLIREYDLRYPWDVLSDMCRNYCSDDEDDGDGSEPTTFDRYR